MEKLDFYEWMKTLHAHAAEHGQFEYLMVFNLRTLMQMWESGSPPQITEYVLQSQPATISRMPMPSAPQSTPTRKQAALSLMSQSREA